MSSNDVICFKTCVLGESKVGKSLLVDKFVDDNWTDLSDYTTTQRENEYVKTIEIDGVVSIRHIRYSW